MTDEFIAELDDCFKRGIIKIPVVGITSLEDLMNQMCNAVDLNRKLSDAQKSHIKDNIVVYIAPAVWKQSKYFHSVRLAESLKPMMRILMPDKADKICSEIETIENKILKSIFTKASQPVEQSTFISSLMAETKWDYETTKKKIEALELSRILSFDGKNYMLGDFGKIFKERI
jgi:hypothetical protein